MKNLQDLCSFYYLQRNFSAVVTAIFFLYSIQGSGIVQERSVTHTQNTLVQSIYLFTKVGPFEGDHAHVNRVGDKSLVVHQLVWSESGDCVEEQLRCLFEVPDGHTVQALVHFQAIPPVPVAPLLNEAEDTVWHEYRYNQQWKSSRSWTPELLPLCFLCVACDEVIIHVEKADPQQVEDDI